MAWCDAERLTLVILVCQRGEAGSDGGEAINSFYLVASRHVWCDDVLQVVRHPRSDRTIEMTLRTMYELCLNVSIAIGTHGSVYGNSAGYKRNGWCVCVCVQLISSTTVSKTFKMRSTW